MTNLDFGPSYNPDKPKPDREVIVEVGPQEGLVSSLSGAVREKIANGAQYLAIDCEAKELQSIKNNWNQDAAVGSLAKLPLRDASANQIWLINVFGGLVTVPEKQEDGSIIGTFGSDQYMRELSRVIKPGHQVMIGEIIPPRGKKGSVDWIKNSELDEYGFEKEVFTGDRLKEFDELHGFSEGFSTYASDEMDPFFVVLTKKEKK